MTFAVGDTVYLQFKDSYDKQGFILDFDVQYIYATGKILTFETFSNGKDYAKVVFTDDETGLDLGSIFIDIEPDQNGFVGMTKTDHRALFELEEVFNDYD